MQALTLKYIHKLSQCNAARKGSDLVDSLATAEKELAEGSSNPSNAEDNVDRYFSVFKLAFDSKQPPLVEIALSACHVLIERGYMLGRGNIYTTNIHSKSSDNIAGERMSEAEKTSQDSKPAIAGADADADAARTMEASAVSSNPVSTALGKQKAAVQRRDIDFFVENITKCSEIGDDVVQLQVLKVLLTAVTSHACGVREASLLLAIQACFHIHLISKNPINKMTAKAALTQMVSAVNTKMEQVTSLADKDKDKDKDSCSSAGRGRGSSGEWETRDVATPSARSRSSTAVSASSVFTTSTSTAGANVSAGANGDEDATQDFASVAHKDSYLVFRALCKLSMKGLYDDSDLVHAIRNTGRGPSMDVNTIAMQNKILSLELILHILETSGPAFRSTEKICDAIRKYLCISLLGNCTSHIAQVSGLSMKIFMCLLESFKHSLKTELEIFFTSIFFKMLESENCTYDHKLRILEAFHVISKDQNTLVEFFINYDCDLDTSDIFRRVVDCFAKIAKNPVTPNTTSADEGKVRKMGIEGIVLILQSMLLAKGINPLSADSGADSAASVTAGDSAETEEQRQIKAERDADSASASAGAATPDNFPSIAVTAFDRKQKMQEQIDSGIIKFNLAPKKGLEFLINVGFIENTPQAVARFLLDYDTRLDKTQIGDFIGREPEYMNGLALKVLHEYVELLDFRNMPFDEAIRYFLRGFRLPGEAQKIDRIMEKFAERYYLQNRVEFASADMAFILAFSTIMLQTNLHNPAIRADKRMTKEQFLKQNTGITSDGELSHELLSGIYDRIALEPISMTEDKAAKDKIKKAEETASAFAGFQQSDESRRMDAFNDERKEMMRKGQSLFKKKASLKGGSGSLFVTSSASTSAILTNEAYVRPMFEAAWAPIMAALSHIFEAESDPALIELTLRGFQYATRLACRLELPVVRATYVNALTKCTGLDRTRMLLLKNSASVKVLLDIAVSEREYLEESWYEVLNCVSQMARLLLYAHGLHSDDMFFAGRDGDSSASSSSSASRSPSKQAAQSNGSGVFANIFGASQDESKPTSAQLEEANAEQMILSDISITDIDSIFHTSHKLSAESVQHFVKGLCAVSILEISNYQSVAVRLSSAHSATPRIFSLQKLVEVADFNMHSRSRIAWGAIWKMLAQHFTTVGTHSNDSLAMYAIDSLKQLSIKFLQKEEFSNFNFQRVFLKPFEVIVANSRSLEIQDLVLHCIEIMILTCSANIRSGWRSIFAIFGVCANHGSSEVAGMAMSMIERLIQSKFELIFHDLVEVVNCFVVFSASAHTQLSLQSLKHLRLCAEKVAATSALATAGSGDEAHVLRLWWPLLLGLSTRIGDSRLAVRREAFNILSDVLKKHAASFSVHAWKLLFKGILFPMMDSAKIDPANQNQSQYPTENPFLIEDSRSWIDTVGMKVLNLCLELYLGLNPLEARQSILPELLAMLKSCICQETEALARIGVGVFADLAVGLGPMDQPTADMLCALICEIICKNLCTFFGPAGRLAVSLDCPQHVAADFPFRCPVQARRSSNCEERVSTVYGDGVVVGVVDEGSRPADSSSKAAGGAGDLELPPRNVVQLNWGVLFGQTANYMAPAAAASSSNSGTMMVGAEVWEEITKSAMTSMIVSLDIIHALSAILQNKDCGFSPQNIEALMASLQVSHWHARSFNEDARLSVTLQSLSFMRMPERPLRPPNLLEQEIQTAASILSLAQLLGKYAPSHALADKWTRTYAEIVFLRYVELDSSAQHGNPIEDDLINAYKPTVLEALQNLQVLQPAKLRSHEGWVVPLITKLILCNDYEIRFTVADLLNRIAGRSEAVHSPNR